MTDTTHAALSSPDVPPTPPPAIRVPGSSERTYACVIHLSTFVAPILGPLVLWLIQKDESSYVDHHGREALNFQITQAAIGLMLVVFGVCTLGVGLVLAVPIVFALGILDLVATIVAAVRANDGVRWRYPLTFRLL